MTQTNNIQISDAEVMAIMNRCIRNIFDDEYNAKKEEKAAKKAAQRKEDLEECIDFCKRVKVI